MVFHEMAHSCGMSHSIDYFQNPNCDLPGNYACDVGEWFGATFVAEFPEIGGPCSIDAGAGRLLEPRSRKNEGRSQP